MAARTGLWSYRGLIGQLAQRELKLRYKRSILGWLWTLITPAAMLGAYTLVFGIFLRVQPPVAGNGRLQSFAVFLFCGLVMWNYFSFVVNQSMGWLMGTGPLLRNVYFPPQSPIIAGSLSTLVQTITEITVLILVLALLGNLAVTALFLPIALLLLMMFSLGIGFLVSLANVYLRDISHIVGIGMTLLFFATPIVYPFDVIPETIWGGFPIQDIIRYNPLTQFVGVARDLLYHLTFPDADRLVGLFIVSLGTFGAGWFIFRRYSARLSEEL
jgi:ABC-type polysaccharide/polyol phosphate export permease